MAGIEPDNQNMKDKPISTESMIPELHDKRNRPEGVVPRQSQAYVIAGLSVLILLAVLFSNRRAKPSTRVASTNSVDVAPATSDAVRQLKRELMQEQQEEQEQQQEQQAERQQTGSKQNGTEDPGSAANQEDIPADPNGTSLSRSEASRDPIADAERALRFKSRFESNFVSANASANTNSMTPGAQPSAASSEAPLHSETEWLRGVGDELPKSETEGAAKHPTEVTVNNAQGQPYAIFEGTTIDTVLLNRLEGDFSGPVKVMVTNPVFSQDRQHVLIPEGTFILGEVQKVSGFGQRRLAVTFHRMIMPDGYSVDLDQLHGLDAAGETGLADKVNNHYLQIFGSSIALGVIAGAAEATTNAGAVESGSDSLRQGMAASLAQSGNHVLDRFLNILPTITIREGHRMKVYLTQDLLMPAYEHHAMPGDL